MSRTDSVAAGAVELSGTGSLARRIRPFAATCGRVRMLAPVPRFWGIPAWSSLRSSIRSRETCRSRLLQRRIHGLAPAARKWRHGAVRVNGQPLFRPSHAHDGDEVAVVTIGRPVAFSRSQARVRAWPSFRSLRATLGRSVPHPLHVPSSDRRWILCHTFVGHQPAIADAVPVRNP